MLCTLYIKNYSVSLIAVRINQIINIAALSENAFEGWFRVLIMFYLWNEHKLFFGIRTKFSLFNFTNTAKTLTNPVRPIVAL